MSDRLAPGSGAERLRRLRDLDRRITVLSDGTPWRPLINVKDMARAIEWAIERDADAGGDFLVVNAGTDAWNYQVHELAAVVAEAVPGTEVSINREAPPDKRSYRVDFSLFKSLAPAHQPQADLLGTVDALRKGLRRSISRTRISATPRSCACACSPI